MFQARSSFCRSGARLIVSSALALTVTFASIPFAIDASAAMLSPPRFAVVSGKVGGKAFGVSRVPGSRITRHSTDVSSTSARLSSTSKGTSDGPSASRKPPVVDKRHPAPPLIITEPVPLAVGGGVSAGGPPGADPSAGPGSTAQPLRGPGFGALPINSRDYLPDEV